MLDMCASWAHFFEIVAAGCIKLKGGKEVQPLLNSLADCCLTSLASISESKIISESVLSSQGLSESPETAPIGDLCSLLLYSISVISTLDNVESDEDRCDVLLGMFGRLYESANRLFSMTQVGSATSTNQVRIPCAQKNNKIASLLLIITPYQLSTGCCVLSSSKITFGCSRASFRIRAVI